MRKVIFRGANSLDNFIARDDGSVDWILWNAEAASEMTELWKNIDTVLMGRNTYQAAVRKGWGRTLPARVFVCSRTMAPVEGVTVVSEDAGGFVRQMKQQEGKDIMVMCGGELASALLDATVIDEIGFSIHPLLLGAGIPLFHPLPRQVHLELTKCRVLSNGVLWVCYRVLHPDQPAAPVEVPTASRLEPLTEDELVREIGVRAHDPMRRSWWWEYIYRQNHSPAQREAFRQALERDARIRRGEIWGATASPDPTDFPPVAMEAVRAAEEALGFAFPPLLVRLWTEVGNGGFGPGYGIFGLEGGSVEESQGLNIVDNYLATCRDPEWPRKLVPVCEWGGDDATAIDCSTPAGSMVDLVEGVERRPKGMTFAHWMEAWVNGADLFNYSREDE